MKVQFAWVGVMASLFMGISTLFIACNKDDMNSVVNYRGQVVYINTTMPFADLTVKVTDGKNTHCQTQTDAGGTFSLKVRVDEIDGNYYLLAGDSTCIPKKVALGSYGQAEVDLGIIEVEGPTLPTVSTKSCTNITDEYAICGGNVTADGRSKVTARGVCWAKAEYPTVDNAHTVNGAGVGEFTSQLSELERGVTYYVRAYATNKQGTAYGNQLTLTTQTGLPEVETISVNEITATSAISCGKIISNGNHTIVAYGVCWSNISATPTILDCHTEEVGIFATYTSMITNLQPGTSYYVRAYATNEVGTNYGASMIFSTLSGLPILTTLNISNATKTSANSGGVITDNGGFAITARGVCWSTHSNPTINDNKTIDGMGLGQFESTIIDVDLTNYTNKYFVRAYATNANGTAYGNELILNYQYYKYEQFPRIEYNGYIYVLMDDIGSESWEEAMRICENLEYAGYDDWSLPSSGALTFIMNHCFSGWLHDDGTPFVYTSYDNRVYAIDSDGHDQNGNV